MSEHADSVCDPQQWSAINCIMKRLYSDFIVSEIDEDGNVLEPKPESTTEKQTIIEINDEHNSNEKESGESILKEDQLQQIKAVSEGELDLCKIDVKDSPKELRKKIHKFIENSYGSSLVTSCENGLLTVKKSISETKREQRKRSRWPDDKGDYLHFILAKENLDTQAAISIICRRLRIKSSLLSVAGTKDRRALTVQRVCAYRVDKSRLNHAKFRNMWLFDFSYSDKKLQLGSLAGNHFSIILRDISKGFDANEFEKRIEHWKKCGFVNSFGSQRFGSCGVGTADVGRFILAGKWAEAVGALLSPQRDGNEALNKCLSFYADSGDASEALKLFPYGDSSLNIERQLLESLAENKNDEHKGYRAAILALPKDVRTLYVHAYQSSVFNRIVAKRMLTYGLKVLPGDLDKHGRPLDNNNSVDIAQVCLPLPSSQTELPKNEVGQWYQQIVEESGIEPTSFRKIENHFSIGSIYRPFIVRPKNVVWKLLNQTSRTQVLQECEFIPGDQMRVPKQRGEEQEGGGTEEGTNGTAEYEPHSRALQIQFDLPPGTYATIALQHLMRINFDKQSQKEREAESLEEEEGGKGEGGEEI